MGAIIESEFSNSQYPKDRVSEKQSTSEVDINPRAKRIREKMFDFWTMALGGTEPGQGPEVTWTVPDLEPESLVVDLKRAKTPSKEQSSRSKPMPGFAPKKGPEGFKQVGLYDPSAKSKPRNPRRRYRSQASQVGPVPEGQDPNQAIEAPKPKRKRQRRIVKPQPLSWGPTQSTHEHSRQYDPFG